MNRLKDATSPYLLQHADNPVHWFPWGEEAFEEARRRDVPILLSVGYSACHWCHVMAHESFEDDATARHHERALRQRQGRPRGAPRRRRGLHGGHAGDDRPGRLADDRLHDPVRRAVLLRHLLPARALPPAPPGGLADVEREARRGARAGSEGRRRAHRPYRRWPATAAPSAEVPTPPYAPSQQTYDLERGGFGDGAEVPAVDGAGVPAPPRRARRRRARRWPSARCEAMARGGMYDQLGGGFARYSVDARLGRAALREDALRQRPAGAGLRALVAAHRRRAGAPRRAGDVRLDAARPAHRPGRVRLARSTPTARPRAARHEEGAYYVWTPEQLTRGARRRTTARTPPELFEVTGTFEHGTSVLQLRSDPDDEERVRTGARGAARRARAARSRRAATTRSSPPGTAWPSPPSPSAARTSTGPIWSPRPARPPPCCATVHWRDGRLLRTSRDGRAGANAGVLEDYADLAEGLIALYARDRRGRARGVRGRAARRRARPVRRRRTAASTTPPTTPSACGSARRTPPTTRRPPGSSPRPARCCPTPRSPARPGTGRRPPPRWGR